MVFSFTAQKREGKAEELRVQGLIPGVVYGAGSEPVSVAFDYNTFAKLFNEAGESSLIDLTVEGNKPVKVLIQDLQHDPIKGKITHVDFRQINMNKEMHATIELNFIGEAPAVKELNGTLIKTQETLDVKCLPKDLVSHLDIDLGVLKTFTDVIHVKDLQMPAGIVSVEDGSQVLAKVAAPLTEEQLKAMEETTAPNLDQIEVEKKGKEVVEGEAEGSPAAGAQDKKEEKKKE